MIGRDRTGMRRRYREIAAVLARHGLGAVSVQLGLGRVLPFHRGLLGSSRRERPSSQAEHLRLALEELGTTAIKLGQVLSTRPDLLDPELVAELEKLRDRVPPVPTEAILAAAEAELGRDPVEVFADFERTPLAAASIGQVHGATLQDGTRVVIKVRKPGVAETVTSDLAILQDLARRADRAGIFGRDYDVEGLAAEFAWTLHEELDYVREGRNADRLREVLRAEPRAVVPAIHWSATSGGVLVMERVDGVRIDDLAALQRRGQDRSALAQLSAELLLRQVFVAGFFHADPHPGNLLVLEDGRLALVDFGMVGRLDDDQRRAFVLLLLATVHQDPAAMTRGLKRLGILRSPGARAAVRRDLERLLDRYYGLNLEQFGLGGFLHDLLAVSAGIGWRSPVTWPCCSRRSR